MTLILFAALCLLLAGFCVWKLTVAIDKLQASQEREQNFRLVEREAAFRREKFLIVMALQNDPRLAEAISKMPAMPEEENEFMMNLAGVGEVLGSKRRP